MQITSVVLYHPVQSIFILCLGVYSIVMRLSAGETLGLAPALPFQMVPETAEGQEITQNPQQTSRMTAAIKLWVHGMKRTAQPQS
jgi:hypothetical protein